jgi:hypothetical protein
MTAYPSYNPNNSSGLGLLEGVLASAPSSVATILGGVAVGIAGIGAVGFAANYLRKGGSLSGLLQMAKSKEGELKAMLPPSMQAKIEQAKADPRLQTALQIAEDPSKAAQLLPPNLQHFAEIPLVQQLTHGVPPSVQKLTQALPPSVQHVTQSLSVHPAYSDVPFETPALPQTLQHVVQAVSQNAPAAEPLAPQTATLEVSAEHLEAIQAFLASKGTPPTAAP